MDSAEAVAEPIFSIDSLVAGGRVSKGTGLVQWTGRGRLQGEQTVIVIYLLWNVWICFSVYLCKCQSMTIEDLLQLQVN